MDSQKDTHDLTSGIPYLHRDELTSQQDFIKRYYTPCQDTTLYTGSFGDEWCNPVANLNTPLSVNTHTRFLSPKLTYQEMEFLAEEPFIQNIIDTKVQDIIGNKGNFKLLNEFPNPDGILDKLNSKLDELRFWDVLREATTNALVYGGSIIYVKTGQDASAPIISAGGKDNAYRGMNIESLLVFPGRNVTGVPGNLADPTDPYYMVPKHWLLQGIRIDATQVVPLIYQDVPKNRKYYYNFLGMSLIQKVAPFVRKLETVYELAIEYASKMRTLHIATDATFTNPAEAYKQLLNIKHYLNNQGVIATSTKDQVNALSIPPSGFHELCNFSAQLLASVARIPATKILGYAPAGLNNTGEYDLKTYYDVIEGYQKTYLCQVMVDIASRVLGSLGVVADLEFEFTPLAQEGNAERTTRLATYAGMLDTLINNDTIDSELAFRMAQTEGIIPEHESFPNQPDPEETQQAYQALQNELNRESPDDADEEETSDGN